jgi:cell wall assembly regulator SMI1
MAPGRFSALPAGAPPDAIAAAEERLGFQLPAEVRESYAVHDGTGGAHDRLGADILPHAAFGLIGVPMLSLDEAVRDREMWVGSRDGGAFDRDQARPQGPVRAEWWSPRWFPVTWDGGGDHLCIDMDPAQGGVAGQVIYFSHEVGPMGVVATGWRAYLEGYASDLEAGRLRFDEDGELVAVYPAEPLAAPDRGG